MVMRNGWIFSFSLFLHKMGDMDIQAEKAIIIEQFKQVNDETLIQTIKNLLAYALEKEQEKFDIPDEPQQLVMDRFARIRKNPEQLLNWDDASKTLRPQ
jgi:hypothetical protein